MSEGQIRASLMRMAKRAIFDLQAYFTPEQILELWHSIAHHSPPKMSDAFFTRSSNPFLDRIMQAGVDNPVTDAEMQEALRDRENAAARALSDFNKRNSAVCGAARERIALAGVVLLASSLAATLVNTCTYGPAFMATPCPLRHLCRHQV